MSMNNPLKKVAVPLSAQEQRFMDNAPLKDATEPVKARKGTGNGKERINLLMQSHVVDEIDLAAKRRGLSRSAYINLAVFHQLEKDKA
jgi:hypothetical protein